MSNTHNTHGTATPARRIALVIVCLFAAALVLRPLPSEAEGAVHLYYFYDPHCSSCEVVQREVLDPLIAQYGDQLVIEKRDITDNANFELLLALEAQYGVSSGSIPEMFIGEYALLGEVDIRTLLPNLVARYAATGVALPEVTLTQPTAAPTTAPAASPAAGGTLVSARVNILIFFSPTCGYCHQLLTEVIPPLQAKYGADLQVRVVNIAEEAGSQFWQQMMQMAGVPDDAHYVPMTLIGNQLMIGADSPAERLDGLIAGYLATEEGAPYALAPLMNDTLSPILPPPATAAPTPAPTGTPAAAGSDAPIYAAYFYQEGCDVCDRAWRDLDYLKQKYPQLQVREFNIAGNEALNQYLCERAGVPEKQRLTAPVLFIGDKYLLGADIRVQNITPLLEPYLQAGAPEPWAGFDANAEQAKRSIIERFQSFGILAVLGAGLLDGVNPCAFATIIFLLSYLAVRKRSGRELLLTGAAFSLGVFSAYLLVGLGLLKALTALPFLNIISKWLYGITAAICLALAVGSVLDYFKARQGRLEEMSLTLPKRLRGVTHKLIRQGSAKKWYVLAALALGLVVSLIELACTGQVYLPTIVFVMGVPELRARAVGTLVLYNLMFILPLVVIFLLVYFGTTSQQLTAWMKKHAATVKIVMAVFFIIMAAWLIYSIVA